MSDKPVVVARGSQPPPSFQPPAKIGIPATRAPDSNTVLAEKALADLHVTDDKARATPEKGTALTGLDAPQKPTKTKSHTLDGNQRAQLTQKLAELGEMKLAEAVASVTPGRVSNLKEPSVLEFAGENGQKQRWIVSNTLRQGGFGKFRIAVQDTSEGAPLMIKGVKEYRLNSRMKTEMKYPSAARRTKAMEAVSLIATHYPSLRKHCNTLFTELNNGEKAIDTATYTRTANWLERQIKQQGGNVPAQISNDLNLRRKTYHVSPKDIEDESALFPLANSPLQVSESVELGGRVYNFSELMRGELADVTGNRMLRDDVRKAVVRSTARDGFARLAEMHQAGIVHRDLKPANIFLDQQGSAQLGDWNLAAKLDGGLTDHPRVGTPGYMAPEMLSYVPYGTEVDVYSMGLTLAKAALSRYIVDSGNTYSFQEKRGAPVRSSYHEAMNLVIDALRFDEHSVIDETSFDDIDEHFENNPPSFRDPFINRAIEKHMERIAADVIKWHTMDPQMCGAVLNFALRGDPEKRASADMLAKHFTALQPSDSPESALAREVSKKMMSSAFDIDTEVARLQAYGEAFNTKK